LLGGLRGRLPDLLEQFPGTLAPKFLRERIERLHRLFADRDTSLGLVGLRRYQPALRLEQFQPRPQQGGLLPRRFATRKDAVAYGLLDLARHVALRCDPQLVAQRLELLIERSELTGVFGTLRGAALDLAVEIAQRFPVGPQLGSLAFEQALRLLDRGTIGEIGRRYALQRRQFPLQALGQPNGLLPFALHAARVALRPRGSLQRRDRLVEKNDQTRPFIIGCRCGLDLGLECREHVDVEIELASGLTLGEDGQPGE